MAVISHEPGAETQWDWVHLPDPPDHWGWRRKAYLLVGSLPYSGRWRGWLSACQDQPHLMEGLHQVASRLGGLTLGWRFDRMSTVYDRQAGVAAFLRAGHDDKPSLISKVGEAIRADSSPRLGDADL